MEEKKKLLQEELTTYELNKADLLSRANGKFVLIKKKKIISIYDSETDALTQGYEKFGNEPFLVKQILETEPAFNYLSYNIAI